LHTVKRQNSLRIQVSKMTSQMSDSISAAHHLQKEACKKCCTPIMAFSYCDKKGDNGYE